MFVCVVRVWHAIYTHTNTHIWKWTWKMSAHQFSFLYHRQFIRLKLALDFYLFILATNHIQDQDTTYNTHTIPCVCIHTTWKCIQWMCKRVSFGVSFFCLTKVSNQFDSVRAVSPYGLVRILVLEYQIIISPK